MIAILISLFVVLIVLNILYAKTMMIRTFLKYGISSLFSKKPHIMETSIYKKRCMPTDLDVWLHMNNGTYLQHCDTGRIKLYLETGIWNVLRSIKGGMTVGASSSRYRKEISPFTAYNLTTKIIYWDDRAFYLEHTFVRCSDNFVCYVGLVKQAVIGVTPDQIIQKLGYPVEKPALIPELEKWIESIKFSSERLRKRS